VVTLVDEDAVYELLTPRACLDRVEETFRWVGDGRVRQATPVRLDLAPADGEFGAGRVLSFPAYVEPLAAAGVKWLGAYQENARRGLPTINAVNVLSDAGTSLPLAIVEGQSVTAMRTAAHAAVGAKYLARADSSTLAIVGCGDQGRTHLALMDELFDLAEVRACDAVDDVRESFLAETRDEFGLAVEGYADAETAVRGADVVCTVTSATRPIVREAWIEPGTHVAATAGFVDLDPALSRVADRWVVGWHERDREWIDDDGPDVWTAPGHSVDLADVDADLTQIVAGERPGRESADERTVMTHMGMPALDTAATHLVYEAATEAGVGTRLRLFE
jgi:ornithine cyclodeaminase/alanine dehydrogenase-like protein (mu-crystallin family)